MTVDELKTMEAEGGSITYERLAFALADLAPEIIALVEACNDVAEMLVPCRKTVPGVYYHGPCAICDLRETVGALNAKLTSLPPWV